MLETITDQVNITVQPNYIPERSDPSKPIYFFSYHITIINTGQETIQLKNRYTFYKCVFF